MADTGFAIQLEAVGTGGCQMLRFHRVSTQGETHWFMLHRIWLRLHRVLLRLYLVWLRLHRSWLGMRHILLGLHVIFMCNVSTRF